MESIHLAVSSSLRQMLLATSGDLAPAPLCGYGSAHAKMSYANPNVTCPTCLAKEKETNVLALEQFVHPDERRLVAACLNAYAFYTWYVEQVSESMLILHRKDRAESVYVRRVSGIDGGEMVTRSGLTVKDGYLWVEWFRGSECVGCKLVGDHQYWTVK